MSQLPASQAAHTRRRPAETFAGSAGSGATAAAAGLADPIMLVNALDLTHCQVCRHGRRICRDTPGLAGDRRVRADGSAPARTLTGGRNNADRVVNSTP